MSGTIDRNNRQDATPGHTRLYQGAIQASIYQFSKYMLYLSLRLLFRMKARGFENVPKEGGGLVVSNHASFIDPPAVGGNLRRQMNYFVKEELFQVPLLGFLLRFFNCHGVKRGTADRGAIRDAVRALKAGGLLLSFPEGTRSPDGNLQEGKPGVAMIAAQAGVDCIPVYVHGSYDAWPRDRKSPRFFSPVRVIYGKPFPLPSRPDGLGNKEYYQLISDEMMRRITALKEEFEANPF